MITVKLAEQEYKIQWEYTEESNYDYPKTKSVATFVEDFKVNRITKCSIYQIVEDNELTLFEGKSKCQPNDLFVKETGRKLSLTRALSESNFNKEERKVFWNTYNNRSFQNLISKEKLEQNEILFKKMFGRILFP